MIEEYLRRLRLERPGRADLASLSMLQQAHQQQIAFENIDVRTGVPLSLEPAALAAKIIDQGRGGFCYELNFLFSGLLDALGFSVNLLSAGVFAPDGQLGPPFDHLCLRVDLDEGPFLCDVGFGRAAVRPVPLVPGTSILDPAGEFRLERLEGGLNGFGSATAAAWSFARRAPEDPRADQDGWMGLYLFDLEPRRIEDFSGLLAHHQHSPESPFPNGLMLTRATQDGRISVRDMNWSRVRGGQRETGVFPDNETRRGAVRADFGIELPHGVDR